MENPSLNSSTIQNPFGDAPTGYGSYDQLFAANPYRKQTYQRSFWDRVAGALGIKTGYDKWLDQTSTQVAEYDAGIFNMMQQNEYNSESAKVARMRAAGENPDLLGTGDVSDSAVPPDDPNGMQPIEDTASSLLTGFGKSLMSAFTTGLQIYRGFADVKMITEQISGIATKNADAVLDLVDKAIVGSVPLSAFEEADSIDSLIPNIDFSKYGLRGKGLEAANSALADRLGSIKNNADIREALYRRYNAISGVNETAVKGLIPPSQMPSSPAVTNEMASPNDIFNIQIATMASASRRIMELAQTNLEVSEGVVKPLELGNEAAEATLQGDALSGMSAGGYGTMQGSVNVQGMASELFNNNVKVIIAEEKAKMYSQLKEMADNGSSFATAMLYSMCLNDMMQFEVTADAGLDLSLLGGVGSIAKKFFKKGSKTAAHELDSASESFRRNFGTGLNLRLKANTK